VKPPDVPPIQRVVYLAGLAAGGPGHADFLIRYELGTRRRKPHPAKGAWGADLYEPAGPAEWIVVERYTISADGVRCRQSVEPASRPIDATRFVFPAMVNDGNREVPVMTGDGTMSVQRAGGTLKLAVLQPATSKSKLQLAGPRVAMHNGYYRAATMDLPADARSVEWIATLQSPPATSRPASAGRP